MNRVTLAASLALGLALASGAPRKCAAQRAASTVATADSSRAPALGDARGAFMALSVADLAASRRWYIEKIGLRPTLEIPPANGGAVVVLEGGGLIVELVQLDSAVARSRSAERLHGFFKSGVIVDDLSRVVGVLRERGVEIAFGPFPARDGQRANAIIRDNAGNWIQLFGAR